jgi:hypothetical protein
MKDTTTCCPEVNDGHRFKIPPLLTSIIQSRIRVPGPAIFIMGVYKPNIPEAVCREQWKVTGSDERTQEHFERLVLIEAVVTNVG